MKYIIEDISIAMRCLKDEHSLEILNREWRKFRNNLRGEVTLEELDYIRKHLTEYYGFDESSYPTMEFDGLDEDGNMTFDIFMSSCY